MLLVEEEDKGKEEVGNHMNHNNLLVECSLMETLIHDDEGVVEEVAMYLNWEAYKGYKHSTHYSPL